MTQKIPKKNLPSRILVIILVLVFLWALVGAAFGVVIYSAKINYQCTTVFDYIQHLYQNHLVLLGGLVVFIIYIVQLVRWLISIVTQEVNNEQNT